jgi:hypothetical protein
MAMKATRFGDERHIEGGFRPTAADDGVSCDGTLEFSVPAGSTFEPIHTFFALNH